MNRQKEIFKQGSKTYYNSSRFFPKDVWNDVSVLYGFVRVADNFVDSVPQDAEGFHAFTRHCRESLTSGSAAGDEIIDSFLDLHRRKGFDPSWMEAFFHSMELDLHKKIYDRLEDTLDYIHGSAEVIGLYMNRIMGISEAADKAACMMGRAMQYINFIRDIDEDNGFGRRYLPNPPTGLESLDREHAQQHRDQFIRYIRKELERYLGWQKEAEAGYRYLPYRYRVPVKTAADMYAWTARQLSRDPMIVFERKVKPPKLRILLQGIWNGFSSVLY